MSSHAEPLLRMAFASIGDPCDERTWSGIPFRMVSGFRAAGLDVRTVGPLQGPADLAWRVATRACRLAGRTLLPDREPRVARAYAAQVDAQLRSDPPDVLLSPGVLPGAHLVDDYPVVIWADATFASMRDYYAGFSDLCRRTAQHAEALEAWALRGCRAAVFTSAWAAASARDHYGVPVERVFEAPLGANLDPGLSEQEAEALVDQRTGDVCRLLLVGVDWVRKGADVAVAVATELNRRGVQTRLTIAGCTPPRGVALPDCVTARPYVLRGDDALGGPLGTLFAHADFFVLPTKAEAFGIVLAEASAFAVPSVTSMTGGLVSNVRDGVTGWLLDPDAPVSAYCDVIERAFRDRDLYRSTALAAHREYRQRLNWRTSCATVASIAAYLT